MAPPLDIEIKSDDSNSVYNHLSQWANLVEKQNISQLLESQASQLIKQQEAEDIKNERNIKTREVLFEKYDELYFRKKQHKLRTGKWEKSTVINGLTTNPNLAQLFESQASTLLEEHTSIGLKNIRQQTINKWASSGLLEGLTETKSQNFAALLDCQSRQLIHESTPVGISSRGFGKKTKTAINYQRPIRVNVEETFLSKIKSFFVSIWKKLFKKKEKLIAYDIVTEPGFSGFDNIAFPLVRQVFAQTMALDLVQVQPLDLPKGLLFYMDGFQEHENVFSRIVIFEKYKEPVYSRYATQSIGRNSRYYLSADIVDATTAITFPADTITPA